MKNSTTRSAKTAAAATLVPLNLTDSDGIARLGAALNERHGKLDILVGNAGVAGPSSPLGHIEMKPWNDVMAVNVIGEFPADPLHGAAAEKIRRRPRGVRHFGAASKALAYLGPYAASKAALEALVRVWAHETAITPIRVNLFNPGPIRTRMRATVFPGEDPMTLDTPEQAAEFIVPMCAARLDRDRQVLRLPDPHVDGFSRDRREAIRAVWPD